jgi:ribonuclease J
MVVRSGETFYRIVQYFFEKHPNDTILLYSMWSGYKSLPGVKQILDIAKAQENVHVSGHITKEDLEHVIEIVAPDKLIIHHTSGNKDVASSLIIPEITKLEKLIDGQAMVI